MNRISWDKTSNEMSRLNRNAEKKKKYHKKPDEVKKPQTETYRVLTERDVERAKSGQGGWNRHQLQLLGIGEWPVPHRWYETVIGKTFETKAIELFIYLKNYHLREDRD